MIAFQTKLKNKWSITKIFFLGIRFFCLCIFLFLFLIQIKSKKKTKQLKIEQALVTNEKWFGSRLEMFCDSHRACFATHSSIVNFLVSFCSIPHAFYSISFPILSLKLHIFFLFCVLDVYSMTKQAKNKTAVVIV